MLEFEQRKTWVYDVNPSVKLLVSLALFIFVIFIDNLNVMTVMFSLTLVTFWLASGYTKKVKLLALSPFLFIFISSFISMTLFGKGETVWWQWGLIRISEESFYRGIHLGMRTMQFGLLGLLMSMTTDSVRLMYSLMQQCKLPAKYAYSFLASFRLIPIIIEEYTTINQALYVRGFHIENGRFALIKKTKRVAIPLLAQSIRRAQRIATSMEAKRFSMEGERTYYYAVGFSWRDLAFIALLLVIVLMSYSLGLYYPLFNVTEVV